MRERFWDDYSQSVMASRYASEHGLDITENREMIRDILRQRKALKESKKKQKEMAVKSELIKQAAAGAIQDMAQYVDPVKIPEAVVERADRVVEATKPETKREREIDYESVGIRQAQAAARRLGLDTPMIRSGVVSGSRMNTNRDNDDTPAPPEGMFPEDKITEAGLERYILFLAQNSAADVKIADMMYKFLKEKEDLKPSRSEMDIDSEEIDRLFGEKFISDMTEEQVLSILKNHSQASSESE